MDSAQEKKVLTGELVLSYTRQFAREVRRIKMMTIRIHTEQTMKWQPCAAMHSLVCSLGVTRSANMFGGRPGQQISEDRRNSRH